MGDSGTSTYALSAWLFLRLLGFIYLIAFASLAVQIKGLAGRDGILPVVGFLNSRRRSIRSSFRLPSLCWINASDAFLLFLTIGGAMVSLMILIDLAPLPALVIAWVFYLSLFSVCRLFLSFQWDVLLLETGFLAIFLAPLELLPQFPPVIAPPRVIVWLFWWLLFRLMFSSGVVKLRSGDHTWRNLTALCYHYETQPLPTPLAWHLHQFPKNFHKITTAVVLVIELAVPLLIPMPLPLRYFAALLFIALMVLIEVTGNYCFFNLLGITLSLLLMDDRVLGQLCSRLGIELSIIVDFAPAPPLPNTLAIPVALLILLLSLETMLRLFRRVVDWPKPLAVVMECLAPFHLVSGYGLFAMMTTERPEIIVEGSDDGLNWKPYEFKWKPGDVKRGPKMVAPHQPRLDWQMWFAALGTYDNHPWFLRFLERLIEGSPGVLKLLKINPFPEHPPRYVRAIMYNYRFTSRAERRASQAWWWRERRGLYCPAFELNDLRSASSWG